MTLTTLRAMARRKISFQSTASAKYGDTDLDANLNMWYRIMLGWVFESTGIWEFNGEMSTTNLVSGQEEYVLPSDFVILNRVEILYPDATDYVKANRIDDKQVDGSAFGNDEIAFGSAGSPVYRTFGNSIFIYPSPTAAVTAGLRIEYLTDITELSASGDVPTLNTLVHHVMAIGAAYEYCLTNEQPRKAKMLSDQLFGRQGSAGGESLKAQVQYLAAQRDRSVKQRIIPRFASFR